PVAPVRRAVPGPREFAAAAPTARDSSVHFRPLARQAEDHRWPGQAGLAVVAPSVAPLFFLCRGRRLARVDCVRIGDTVEVERRLGPLVLAVGTPRELALAHLPFRRRWLALCPFSGPCDRHEGFAVGPCLD